MKNLCTLFDSFYLSRALVMYDSLIATKFDFHLYIFAFDQLTYDILWKFELERVTVISLSEFEDEKLLSVKGSRSKAEYCWTSTPSTIHYAIKKLGLPDCTYIDADLYFYNSPMVLFDELDVNSSALITEHRYTKLAKAYEGKRAGRFCVQFLNINDNEEGIKLLETWRDQCIDWCYDRYENGKFGDQKYLDNWPENYQNVHILGHHGGGVAPWNIKRYKIILLNGKLLGIEKETKSSFDLVFYHFHFVKLLDNGYVDIGWHPLSRSVVKLIYQPYIKAIKEKEAMIEKEIPKYKTKWVQPLHYKGLTGIVKQLLKKQLRYNYIKQ